MSLQELFAGRLDVSAVMARLGQVADDLDLPFGDRSHTYNSRRAQELGKWAEQQNKEQDFQDAIYRAYFVDGKNISQIPILTEIAAGIGLNSLEAEQVLLQRSFAGQVDNDWNRARSMGITAVPSMRYGDKFLVGFHPYEEFRKLLSD